jgi:flagellar motor component MotA
MHIINTNAVEVSIHAVSPLLILSALMMNGSVGAAAGAAVAVAAALGPAVSGAAVAALAGASSAHAKGTPKASRLRKTNRDNIFIGESP